MAKASLVYSGNDSYGRPVMVAKRTDGQWFSREYGFNGYGRGWSKWTECDDLHHPTQLKCAVEYADSPEYVALDEQSRENFIEYGFNVLRLSNSQGLRLPN